MDCREFEARFERLLGGELPPGERAACAAHVAACPACRELLELAGLPGAEAKAPAGPFAEADDLVARVLERTSGSPCARAGELLAGRLDGVEPRDALDRELLELHVAACDGCRGLARVLTALGRDLPGLAEVRPDPRFVDEVLARTVPAAVRWRRTLSRAWAGRWSAWVRRPRFAWEAAFVLTVACLPVLTSSASPIPPLAAAARELSADKPVARVEATLDRTLTEAGEALIDLEAVQRTGRGAAEAREVVEDLGARTATWAERWTGMIGDALRTLRHGAASFLAGGADGDTEPRRPEETDRNNPTDTPAGDGSKGETR